MSFVQRQLGGRKPISTSLSRTFSDPQVAGQHGRCPEAFKNTSPAPNVNKMDWATWLVSDIQDAGSDNDLDYEDIEEKEVADTLSDNDLSEVELDGVKTVCELCEEQKMQKDKIGILEQQLDSLQKAAALEMSAREALESSAKEAIEQAAEGKKAVEAANIALTKAQRQINWHQDQKN